MNPTTKQLLLDIAKRLDSATETAWSRGDLDDFSNWAKCMKSTIATVTPILRTIANSEPELNTFE